MDRALLHSISNRFSLTYYQANLSQLAKLRYMHTHLSIYLPIHLSIYLPKTPANLHKYHTLYILLALAQTIPQTFLEYVHPTPLSSPIDGA
jgi:hypothetical protein